jgi:WD40 repeat protein
MTFSYHKKAATCVTCLLDSSLVFSGSLDGLICAWSTEQYNSKPLIVLTPHQGSVYCLAVQEDWEENADGPRRLILYSNGDDGTIKIWRIAPEDNNNQCIT